jgi:hypothetical protein
MILVYCPKITNRINYVFKLILKDLLGTEFQTTTDEELFKLHIGPKFSYAPHPVSDELIFLSKNILFENDIRDYSITVSDRAGVKIFFPVGKVSALPFDPFAASFYLVSRYEEYLPHIKDDHERFDAKESLAYQEGFLDKPVVNIWAGQIKNVLLARFPELEFQQRKYEFISTIDIDNAYAYKEKGAVRTLGALARALINVDFNELKERMKVFTGRTLDPYDTYDYQLEIQRKYDLKVLYFILMADYGINDKNVPVQNQNFQSLIKSLADYAEVGIHPGYNSAKSLRKLKEEHRRLEQILKREVKKSRQHFLKLSLPETYRNLLDIDITDDYTMGFASKIGFRAGIAAAFNFYDLDLDVETSLKIHPFAVMDATLKYYMKLTPENAMEYVAPLIDEVKAVNGTFISLWHNETLSENHLWKGWRNVFEEMMKYASAK